MLCRLASVAVNVSVALLLVGACAAALAPATDQGKDPVVEILNPKDGQQVERVEEIRGRIKEKGAWPILLVAPVLAGEPFYVQPPVSEVDKDGLFQGTIHFGNEQTPKNTKFRCVVLVAKDKKSAAKYKTGMELKSLPGELPRSHFITVTLGGKKKDDVKEQPKPRMIQFGGHPWQVRDSSGKKVGPGGNLFSPLEENVRLDKPGHLRLAITKRGDGWHSCELIGPELGHGEYSWIVSGRLAKLDPQVVLGLFLYKDDDHEIDFELSRWGDVKKPNGQFVVQPAIEANMHRFDTGKAEVLACRLTWTSKELVGRCWAGEDLTRPPLATWKFAKRTPRPEGMRVRMNFWLFDGQQPSGGENQTVVIKSFHFKAAAAK